MKFARLYLKAFGPFRDRVIELPGDGGKDLHVIFGPNEAGKSTLLRAVRDVLFGIPERTGDAFLHDYNALRVGATLLLPDGSRLSAMRRKARKATLFAIDEHTGTETTDRPLPEDTLTELLGGLDQALYQNLFGLDLNGLVAGSDELLRGEGEVGRSLFQAAAGLASLRSLITGLEEEATAAFKPRGSTSRLNRALNEFDDQRRILKDSTVRSYAWEAAERAHRQAEAKHAQLREALKGKRGEQQRLERVRGNLPLVAERAATQAELESLAEVPVLTLDAAQRRVTAQERLRGADERKAAVGQRLLQIQADLEGLVVRHSVLEQGSAIEQAYHGVAAYRMAREAIPGIATQHAARTNQIRQLLAEIEPACEIEQAATLQPPETLAARVAERLYAALGEARRAETKRQQLANDIKREEQALDDAETTAQQARTQLDELVRQARCLNADELPDIEAKAARKQTLQQRRVEIDEQLVQQNARPIDEVESEAEGLGLDGIARQIADVATEIEDLEAQVEAAQSARFQAKQQLDAIDGGPAAAEAHQNLSSLSARIAKEARVYARARLAGAVLNRVVQVYRERHQGPLLRRAAEVFARITLGSFSGLTVDHEDDRQVLLGVRPDGTGVPVAGMSQGTRDQLFLSLRLAAIEQHLESRGPMPVIIDDLLVQFDDDRAVATMEVLAELSDKTQVMFFTHHRHLVELAGKAKLATAVTVHNL